MSWNYRIFRKTFKRKVLNSHMEKTDHEFEIREAYYNKKGKVDGWTATAIAPHGDTVDDLIAVLNMMLLDAKKSKDDVLDAETGKMVKL